MRPSDAKHGRLVHGLLVVTSQFALWGTLLSVAVGASTDGVERPENTEFRAIGIAGPFVFPSSIAFLPCGSMLVAERRGRLYFVEPGSAARQLTGIPPVVYAGHGGLLDIAVDPDFAANADVYLSYAHGTVDSSALRVARAQLDLRNGTLKDLQVIFESAPPATGPELLGGRMALTLDGHLFLTLGDRQEAWRAQDPSDHTGSIVRIRTDGSVPEDNQFTLHPGMRPEIGSYGHRNPQGLALDHRTGRLWSHEHGPKGGDELNVIIRGRNYGWPIISHGTNYSGTPIGEGTAKEGMEQPVRHWTPAIAPSGLALEFTAAGTALWISALVGQSLMRLEMDDGRIIGERHLLRGALGRIRDVRVGPDGRVHFVTDHPEGALYRLERAVEQAEAQRPEAGAPGRAIVARTGHENRSRRVGLSSPFTTGRRTIHNRKMHWRQPSGRTGEIAPVPRPWPKA